jgi:hypothetical protein
MENLTEKVFECTLPVEAHMICDLLARAGISARVDGEFLAGAGGDLPLGNSVKVRVDPARAAEGASARIASWTAVVLPGRSLRCVVCVARSQHPGNRERNRLRQRRRLRNHLPLHWREDRARRKRSRQQWRRGWPLEIRPARPRSRLRIG